MDKPNSSTQRDERPILDAARRLYHLLDTRERRMMFVLIPAMTLMALMQVVGIASVFPFLALIAAPDVVTTNASLAFIYERLGFESTRLFLVFAGVSSMVLLFAGNALTALAEYLLLRFSWAVNHTLSLRLLRAYLSQPYVYFLQANTASLATNLLGEVRQVVSGFVISLLHLISRSIVTLFILALIGTLYPLLAALTFGFLGIAYSVSFVVIRRRMGQAGRQRAESDRGRYKAASEALAGIKDIQILGREEPFLERFRRHSHDYSKLMASQQAVTLIPRYALEIIAFGGMLLIVLVLLLRGSGVQLIVPTLGVFAIATLRLLTALQSLFSAVTNLRFSSASVDVVYRDLANVDLQASERGDREEPLALRSQIALRDVGFSYPHSRRPVLDKFTLVVPIGSSVGIVGATGSGKTTTVDLMLGLLQPDTGTVTVDDAVIDAENRRAWQRNLGYVPQQVYLADDTIAANIAFGVAEADIDRARVEQAARVAHIHDFIVTELADGYDTAVGERGVRLSGGQRQRLGIARALYHDPAVLVFDEATSALDSVTEEGILRSIRELEGRKTTVVIAHRMTTVRGCDIIYLLEKGKVLDSGSFDDLMVRSKEFRTMALAGYPGSDTGPMRYDPVDADGTPA